ncbi:MAG TPA: type IV pilus biogenesis/stability protein PilW [Arenimonas sp.]|uniref:type IV pilus biogenesis/stability protein PilW n=1 Tax=Arenimonas sp. TaxID=1872635 RepID=UPI002D81156D|nr:type IV pilus biogenesis/stability protein PilW [Arenimonas sp.]HEU0153617.1 type IV pilus biogenesis/stability protein PilW [Arenimonas sp.]
MPRNVLRHCLVAGVLAITVGCAGTPASNNASTGSPGSQAAMTSKGVANLNLAQNYLAANKLEYALDRANRALRSDPNSADVQVVLGLIRERLGDSARAGEHFERAGKLDPESGHVLNVYGVWLCEKGQAAEADAVFARAVKDPFYKARDQAFFNAGKCAMDAGRLEAAEAHLRQGIEVAPDDPRLLALMAELQFRAGNYMSARAFYQRRESQGALTADLLYLAARIEQGAGDTVAARRYRQRLQDQFPDFTPSDNQGSLQP